MAKKGQQTVPKWKTDSRWIAKGRNVAIQTYSKGRV